MSINININIYLSPHIYVYIYNLRLYKVIKLFKQLSISLVVIFRTKIVALEMLCSTVQKAY